MTRYRTVLFALLILAPAATSQVVREAPPEAYRVWSAYLNKSFSQSPRVLLMAELRDDPRIEPASIEAPSPREVEALEAFNRSLDEYSTVEDRFEVSAEVVVLDHVQREEIRAAAMKNEPELDAYYRALFQEYPGTPGLVELSPVGFSKDSATAFFFPVVHQGGLRCSGRLVLMERVGPRWVVKERGYGGFQIIC